MNIAAQEVFYDSSVLDGETESEIEASRLDAMAVIADDISVDALQKSGLVLTGKRVVDIGAGDSVTLGDKLVSEGVRYIPIDQRPDAVNTQRGRFPDASLGDVTNFSEELQIVPHLVHARFVYGWLTVNQRSSALAESLRSFKDAAEAKLVIIDYDWSIVDGPDAYTDAVGAAVGVMRTMGFDPDYGASSETDILERLQKLGGRARVGDVAVQASRYGVDEDATLDSALSIIRLTAESIIERLDSLGMADDSRLLRHKLDSLESYALRNPNDAVVLPAINVVSAQVASPGTFVASSNDRLLTVIKHAGEYEPAECVFEEVFPLPHTKLAVSDAAKLAARRVQAASYYIGGIVGPEAIAANGALIPENDSHDLVSRSAYIATGEEGQVKAVIRMIATVNDDVVTLPTVERLREHGPDAYRWLRDQGVGSDGGRVMEVSGLAKMPGGQLGTVVDSIIGLSLHSSAEGYKHAVMGLQGSLVALIQKLFGPDAIRVVPTEDASHPVQLPGVNRSLSFRAMYVDVENFFGNIALYAAENRDGALVRKVHDRVAYVQARKAGGDTP